MCRTSQSVHQPIHTPHSPTDVYRHRYQLRPTRNTHMLTVLTHMAQDTSPAARRAFGRVNDDGHRTLHRQAAELEHSVFNDARQTDTQDAPDHGHIRPQLTQTAQGDGLLRTPLVPQHDAGGQHAAEERGERRARNAETAPEDQHGVPGDSDSALL